jgi:hypothetical protein
MGQSKDVNQRKRRRKTADEVKDTAAQKAAVKAAENKKGKALGAEALFGLARTAASGTASTHDSNHNSEDDAEGRERSDQEPEEDAEDRERSDQEPEEDAEGLSFTAARVERSPADVAANDRDDADGAANDGDDEEAGVMAVYLHAVFGRLQDELRQKSGGGSAGTLGALDERWLLAALRVSRCAVCTVPPAHGPYLTCPLAWARTSGRQVVAPW